MQLEQPRPSAHQSRSSGRTLHLAVAWYANILHADQHRDDESSLFFMRVEWALEDFDLDEASLREKFGSIAAQFSMTWHVEYSDRIPVIAIFVSSYLHCLADLLHRHQTGS